MEVNNSNVLRSITNEAGRQADFYQRRTGAETECQFWSELEGLASECRRRSRPLVIEMRDVSNSPLPIKHREYCEQPASHNVIKAFQ
jgi:hypothetical protein